MPNIALYGIVRCPGRGHDIVKSHDIVGAPTISCRHDIVSPPTILLREYDIVPRSCYRVCVRYRARGAISSPARDIAGPRGNIVRFPTISWVGRGIVPTRVIVSATRDIVGRDRISPRAPTISCVCALSCAGRDIVPRARYRKSAWQYRTLSHDIVSRAWYRAFPRYRERDARYRAARDVIAAPCCDIVKPHDIAGVSRYRVVCARYREPVHDIVGSVNEIPLAVRS